MLQHHKTEPRNQGTTKGKMPQKLPNSFLSFLHKHRYNPNIQTKTFYPPGPERTKICLEVPLNVLNGFAFLLKSKCIIEKHSKPTRIESDWITLLPGFDSKNQS